MQRSRRVRRSGRGMDPLGLVTLGSVVANIVQAVDRDNLSSQHERLRRYAGSLNRMYRDLLGRYRAMGVQYRILRQENDRLWQDVQQLHRIVEEQNRRNAELQEENARLRSEPRGSGGRTA